MQRTGQKHSEPETSLERGFYAAQRVLVVGPGSSGKSTLAIRLGKLLNLEIIHLDQHYWHAGWRETPSKEWEDTVRGLIQRKSWVMDGNYGRTMDMRLDAADAVVFLGLPRNLYVRRVLARRLRYAGRSRPDILRKLRSLSSDKAVFVPRSPTEVDQLVSGLEENPKAMQNR